MAFLEERFPIQIDMGSMPGVSFANEITLTQSDNRYARSIHPYPKLRYGLGLRNRTESWFIANVLDFYMRAKGANSGFRIKHHADFTTNAYRDAPTFSDQPMAATATAGVYQLMRWYGDPADSEAARRRIKKPVAGTVLVGITDESANEVQQLNGWSVDTTTGLVTFDANQTHAITNISQAANAVVTIGAHSLVADDTVHFSSVTGMTEINGLRGTVQSVTGTTITVDIDSSGFTVYSSGGDVNTRPQANEEPTAGCEFDIPVWFEAALEDIDFTAYEVMSGGIYVVELLNP